MAFPRAHRALTAAVAERACPAASVAVGRSTGPLWTAAFGRLTYDPAASTCEPSTIFDLASLTKVIVTATLAMRRVAERTLDLEAPISTWFPDWRRGSRSDVRVRHLLDHSSGLPAHARLWEQASGPAEYERAITDLQLERQPGAAAVYSDLGFILLGFMLERIDDGRTLDRQFGACAADWDGELMFRPDPVFHDRIAPTEFDPWRGRLLQGEVHDENAAGLGGVAGHAGLFGSVIDVGRFAQIVLQTFHEPTMLAEPRVMRMFAQPSSVPASSRALAWDTMRPTSSCGTRLSASAIGHTGYTGTSLWIDWERDLYIALLTNRVHPTRENQAWAARRPAVHDAIVEDLETR